jgi:hypothetical protein
MTTTPTNDPRIADFRKARAAMTAACGAKDAAFVKARAASEAYQDAAEAAVLAIDAYTAARERMLAG